MQTTELRHEVVAHNTFSRRAIAIYTERHDADWHAAQLRRAGMSAIVKPVLVTANA